MNRLSHYFAASRLVKDRLIVAQSRVAKVKDPATREALEAVVASFRELMVAFNNVAHIGFKAKGKSRGLKRQPKSEKEFKEATQRILDNIPADVQQ